MSVATAHTRLGRLKRQQRSPRDNGRGCGAIFSDVGVRCGFTLKADQSTYDRRKEGKWTRAAWEIRFKDQLSHNVALCCSILAYA
ncbi:unnamed protein product [Protopolystoma xenopodis]|uniref:Uncharacterized protein n=1 Tax=Protopolystoma xenopodis TaxID=117903 RepID=A0A3S5B0C6_9PLAT|nr:unnamed protein product [Protopolystoma xenopodis]